MRPTREMRPAAILTSGLGGSFSVPSNTVVSFSSNTYIDDVDNYYEATTVEGALAELAAKVVGYQAHGNLGATETFDAAIGWHSGTLDANLTVSLTANPSGTVSSMVLELQQDGTGGWTIDLPASVINSTTLEAAFVTTALTSSLLLLMSRDGGTNWFGFWAGGAGGSSLTVEDEGVALSTAATTLDFVGSGVTASGAGAEKTITIPGLTTTALETAGVVGPILIADDHSTPLVFADLIQTEDGDDLLYADVGT